MYKLPSLPYQYSALEPYIDAKTMFVHYNKHFKTYLDNLNTRVKEESIPPQPIESLIRNTLFYSEDVRNNGGGYYNHNLFWTVMSPNGGGKPSGDLADAIDVAFGSFDEFKAQFAKAGATRFGSGWAWLCVHKGGKVEVCSTPNQDNPLMPDTACGGFPILGMDVWEHAYYLNYQNRRPDYIEAFFNVINWTEVARLYATEK